MTGGDGSGKERKHSGPILNSPSDKTRHECVRGEKKVDRMEQKSEGLQVKECSQVKVIRRVERTDRVVSLATGLSLCLSTSLPLSLSSGG